MSPFRDWYFASFDVKSVKDPLCSSLYAHRLSLFESSSYTFSLGVKTGIIMLHVDLQEMKTVKRPAADEAIVDDSSEPKVSKR